jgi:hypothetical protein
MIIESYNFGEVVIGGRTFRQDVLILPDRIIDQWWRKEGHLLQLDDLGEALAAAPQVLIVGTGMPGKMRVDPGLAQYLQQAGIDLFTLPTQEACRRFNELAPTRKTVAALHLTC